MANMKRGKPDGHRQEADWSRRAVIVTAALVAAAAAAVLAVNALFLRPAREYDAAIALMDTGNEQEALDIFLALGDYKDAPERVEELRAALAQKERP